MCSSDLKGAYTDCLKNGVQSDVFSQQSQTIAYISGVAQGERAARCRDIMYNPPEGFVKAGSPFFEFFLLEALQQEDRVSDFLHIIRRDWGFMIEAGASSFWELWSLENYNDGSRLTRSHCHGWSAAPTYFLSAYVLGVTPTDSGFRKALVCPHIGDLRFCRGAMPTPYGEIEVSWSVKDGTLDIHVRAPKEITLDVQLPQDLKHSLKITQ